jgi:5'-3' exonuclease
MSKLKLLIIIIVSVVLLFACNREARNKRAQQAGQAVTEEKASFLKGLGEGLKGVGKEAAESLSEGVGEVLKGGKEGFDKSFIKKEIRVKKELQAFLNATRCEINQMDSLQRNVAVVYAIFENDFDGKLVLKAFDKNDEEIARSAVFVNEKSDNSRFVEFPFDNRTSFLQVQYLTLEDGVKNEIGN